MIENPSLSVVIPVYNSEGILNNLVARLGKALPELSSVYEVVLVNDGSRDGSWKEICKLKEDYPWIVGINLMRNYGQHNALLCGIRAARNEVIITMDDDLQHPPEEMHKLLEKLAEGYDVVYGIPNKLPHSWWRNMFSVFTKRTLAYIMDIKTIRDISSYRAFNIRLRKAFEAYQNPTVEIDVLLSWGTSSFVTVPVDLLPREIGRSNYNFYKLYQMAMVVLTGYSTFPLRVTSLIGFLFTLIGIGVFLYVIGVYFFVGSVPGFPFLAAIVSMFSGTQLFALGIIGEYLSRVFDRSVDRPVYMIRETLETAPASETPPERTAFSQP